MCSKPVIPLHSQFADPNSFVKSGMLKNAYALMRLSDKVSLLSLSSSRQKAHRLFTEYHGRIEIKLHFHNIFQSEKQIPRHAFQLFLQNPRTDHMPCKCSRSCSPFSIANNLALFHGLRF